MKERAVPSCFFFFFTIGLPSWTLRKSVSLEGHQKDLRSFLEYKVGGKWHSWNIYIEGSAEDGVSILSSTYQTTYLSRGGQVPLLPQAQRQAHTTAHHRTLFKKKK
jgi:hypothetical protein